MIAFGHTAVGTLVGLATYQAFGSNDPVLGLTVATGAGIISHYVTDTIPHGHFFGAEDYHQKIVYAILFDFALSLIVFFLAAYLSNPDYLRIGYIMAGIAGAQLPDILDGLVFTGYIPKKGIIKKEVDFHELTHWHGKNENVLLLGLSDIWQLTVVIISLVLIFTL